MVRTRAVVVATLLAATLALGSIVGWWLGRSRHAATPSARVVRAIDGDTIVVGFADGHTDTVRLLGIDTPETHDPRKPVQCFGPEAAAFTAWRLTDRVVRLESDVESRDRYGRRLAYVYLRGERFNDELLGAGTRGSSSSSPTAPTPGRCWPRSSRRSTQVSGCGAPAEPGGTCRIHPPASRPGGRIGPWARHTRRSLPSSPSGSAASTCSSWRPHRSRPAVTSTCRPRASTRYACSTSGPSPTST